ncbi:MAG TPA: hybrid sensor histidine kinase/response regulator [Steroidobacteraceae bacterium]|nr:hybrid sensor histidine kinase/response regulator [Steroidobacteraceae bacterium]
MRAELDTEKLLELVRLHAQALLRMPWVQALLVVGVGFFVHGYIAQGLFIAWGITTIAVELLRAQAARIVLRRGDAVNPRRVHRLFVVLAALSGGAIGLGGVWFLPHLPVQPQALFGAVLFTIPAAGVAVSQSSRYILAAYALSMLPPAALEFGVLHPTQAWGITALTLLYCAVLILVAADGERLLLRSIVIRHERDRLVRDLEDKNTAIEAAKAEAEQSARARARVLAAASHDLRQPLHALSVYSAVLAANPTSDVLREVSHDVDQIVRSLGNLLHGLLDLSRLSAGNYVPEREQFAVDSVLRGVCSEFQDAAARKGLALVVELTPIRVLGDAVAVGRITRNLLDNAIKYTEAGEVRVTLRPGQDQDGTPLATIDVADTGKGIPESEHARIFEEFYQLDNPGRDRSRGVGLGLAIVQRLCELTGARISLESKPGSGTRMRITLRAEAVSDPPESSVSAAAGEVPLQGKRVYVVDDERDIRNSMRALCRAWGMLVETAESSDSLERLFAQQGPPDLMIIDLRLGEGEHGAQLAERMQSRYGDFAVLIITGETSSDALREANRSRYTLLHKPIAAEVLRRAIGAAVAREPAPPVPAE